MVVFASELASITSWLSGKLNALITKFASIFLTLIAGVLYCLQIGFFWLIDCVQSIFRSMAGLGTYYYQGEEQSNDIVLSIVTSDTIMTIFWSVLIVAIMLLFVTTFVAIIRVEFTEKGAGNAKGPIIGRAIKSLFYFACVPVVSLFGIWIANVFLKSLDEATSNQSYALSTTVFFAASHDANRARNDTSFCERLKNDSTLMTFLGLNDSSTQEEVASAIDEAFLQRSTYNNSVYVAGDDAAFYWMARHMQGVGDNLYISTFDCSQFYLTYYFYDLCFGYSYLIGWMGGGTAALLLLSSCIALIQRIYEIAILFVISPTMVAFMPLDDGKKYGQWRGEFVKRVGMAYGPVIGINLLLMILAVLRDVDLFYPDTGLNAVFNGIVQLIFLIVGLLSVKEFSSLISSLAGSDDAIAKGENKKGEVQNMASRTAAGVLGSASFAQQLGKGAKNTIANTNAYKNWEQGRLDNNAKANKDKIAADLKSGKYYYDDKAKMVKKKDALGRWKKDGNNRELNDDEKNSSLVKSYLYHDQYEEATDAEKAHGYSTVRDKKLAARASGTLGNQAKMIYEGDGKKTGIGQGWGLMMGAAGKDFERYFTRKGMVESKGLMANLPLYHDENGFSDIGGHDAAASKKGEKEKAEKSQKAQADKNAKAIAKELGSAESGGNIKGPIDVNIVSDQTGGRGSGNPLNPNANTSAGDGGLNLGENGEIDFTAGDGAVDVRIVGDETKSDEPPQFNIDNSVFSGLVSAAARLNSVAGAMVRGASEIVGSANRLNSSAQAIGKGAQEISRAAKDLASQEYKAKKG